MCWAVAKENTSEDGNRPGEDYLFSGGPRGSWKVDSEVPCLEMDQAAVTCRFVNKVPLLSNSVHHNCIMFALADITIQYHTNTNHYTISN